jgi:hypothetical protein
MHMCGVWRGQGQEKTLVKHLIEALDVDAEESLPDG